jgi:hypothetical protein
MKRERDDETSELPSSKHVKSEEDSEAQEKCPVCSHERIEYGAVICVECDADCGCKRDACWVESGSFCSECKIFSCDSCGGIVPCDECLELYCEECADLKPGKNGDKRCRSCQPWWQKNKPANAFCKDCGSQRAGHIICSTCNQRVCSDCPYLTCEVCEEDSYCEGCADLKFCPKCEISTCEDCECECEGGDGDEEGSDEGVPLK